jgi:RNA recognition motif-containing protein
LGATNPYESRFAANIAASVRQCHAATDGPKEREALRKIIRLWREAGFFTEQIAELAQIVELNDNDAPGGAVPMQQQMQQMPFAMPGYPQQPPQFQMPPQQQQQQRMMMPPPQQHGGPQYGYPPQQMPHQYQQQPPGPYQQQPPYQQQHQQQQQQPFGMRGGPPPRRGGPGAFDYDYGDNMNDADRVEQQRLRRIAEEQRANDPNAFAGPPGGAAMPRGDLTSALSMLATGLAAAAASNVPPPQQSQGGPMHMPPHQGGFQQHPQQQQFFNNGNQHNNNNSNSNSNNNNNNNNMNGNAGGFRGGPGGPGGPGGRPPRTEGDIATSTTLFVGNVGSEVTEPDLKTMFATFGDVVRLNLRADKHCAFVTFRLREQADAARTTMDGFKVTSESRGLSLGWAPGREEDRLAVARAQAEVMARELQESVTNMQSTASELAGFDVHQHHLSTPSFVPTPSSVPSDPFTVPTTPVVAAPPPTWNAAAVPPPTQQPPPQQPPPQQVPVVATDAASDAEQRRMQLQAQFERRSAMRDQMTNRGPPRGFQQQQQQMPQQQQQQQQQPHQHQHQPHQQPPQHLQQHAQRPPSDMGPPPPRFQRRSPSPVRGRSRSPQPRVGLLPTPAAVAVPTPVVAVQTKPQDVDSQLLDDIYGE